MFQVGERKTAKVKEGKAKKKTSGNKYQKSVTYKLLRGFLSSRSFVIPSDLKKKIQVEEREVVNRVAAEDERRKKMKKEGLDSIRSSSGSDNSSGFSKRGTQLQTKQSGKISMKRCQR